VYIATSDRATVAFVSYYYAAVTGPSIAGNTVNFDWKPVGKTAADFDNGAIIFGRETREKDIITV